MLAAAGVAMLPPQRQIMAGICFPVGAPALIVRASPVHDRIIAALAVAARALIHTPLSRLWCRRRGDCPEVIR
jgi:hypothetical protein